MQEDERRAGPRALEDVDAAVAEDLLAALRAPSLNRFGQGRRHRMHTSYRLLMNWGGRVDRNAMVRDGGKSGATNRIAGNLEMRVRAQALAGLFAAGATLALLTVLLPHSATANEVGLLSIVGGAYLVALGLSWRSTNLSSLGAAGDARLGDVVDHRRSRTSRPRARAR